MTLDEALALVGDGGIVDAKTIMLVQHWRASAPRAGRLQPARFSRSSAVASPVMSSMTIGAELFGRNVV